jgi:hypothetical protein
MVESGIVCETSDAESSPAHQVDDWTNNVKIEINYIANKWIADVDFKSQRNIQGMVFGDRG